MKVDISKGFDIGALHFNVVVDGPRMQGEHTFGVCCHITQTIILRDNVSADRLSATFLHELVEAVNNQFELQLPHSSICALESGLSQALKGLGIEFVIGGSNGTD